MRQEDKEVDGPDLEHAEERKRETELVEEKEDEVYDLDGLPETTLDGERAQGVTAAMRGILAGDRFSLNALKLHKRQLTALEALKTAVEGKDPQLSRFVFAEDRRTLLEQALAVLQPELASMQGAGAQFDELFAKVGELRETLNYLEDAESELVEGRAKDFVEDKSDTDDKDDDDDLDDEKKPSGGKPKKKPAKADQPAGDTSLDGPERPMPPKSTTLGGPERPVAPKEPTTLDGPERSVLPKGATTLDGPERSALPTGTTTLGDPTEIAEAARNEPRWRRSGG